MNELELEGKDVYELKKQPERAKKDLEGKCVYELKKPFEQAKTNPEASKEVNELELEGMYLRMFTNSRSSLSRPEKTLRLQVRKFTNSRRLEQPKEDLEAARKLSNSRSRLSRPKKTLKVRKFTNSRNSSSRQKRP